MISKNSFCKRGRNLLLRWRQDGAKEALRWLEDGSKKALLGPNLAHLGVLWRHVGSLVQSLSPSCLYDTLDWREDAPT